MAIKSCRLRESICRLCNRLYSELDPLNGPDKCLVLRQSFAKSHSRAKTECNAQLACRAECTSTTAIVVGSSCLHQAKQDSQLTCCEGSYRTAERSSHGDGPRYPQVCRSAQQDGVQCPPCSLGEWRWRPDLEILRIYVDAPGAQL